ncbi:integrase [Baekduia alba]|uniref:tyrosine-type recombinase/integrase n=1 Tax=Baekduia alba TaxID=2997333 RepID=UPI00234217DC|nr:tyrosine-type recombinase/integrase [Baekduia alba]WCB93311.1 integrase [Baekduia alba]
MGWSEAASACDSGEGKSDESTRRSVPVADEAFDVLKVWKERSAHSAPDDLVVCHPESGKELDRSKVTRRFRQACRDAGVRVIRFHDLRHTFGTQKAAAGHPLREDHPDLLALSAVGA